jgi:hypothetical protein
MIALFVMPTGRFFLQAGMRFFPSGLKAQFTFWPAGKYFPLAGMHNLPFARKEYSAGWPAGK